MIRPSIFIMPLVLALVACQTAPVSVIAPPPVTSPPTGSTTVGNNACAVFNTLAWGIPLVANMAGAGKLNANQQALLADAEAVVTAGCQPSDASLMTRAGLAARALVAVLWPAA